MSFGKLYVKGENRWNSSSDVSFDMRGFSVRGSLILQETENLPSFFMLYWIFYSVFAALFYSALMETFLVRFDYVNSQSK